MTFSKGKEAQKNEQKTEEDIFVVPATLTLWAAAGLFFASSMASYEASLDNEFNRSSCMDSELVQGDTGYTFCTDGKVRSRKTQETPFGDFQISAVYDLRENIFRSQMVETRLPNIYKTHACSVMEENDMKGHVAFKYGCN